MSAEVETGSTPLLLSVTSMDSLEMDLFLKQRRAHIGALGVDVEILMTRTKHRAIDLTSSRGLSLSTVPQLTSGQGPALVSPNEDLFIYLTEEAAYQICEALPVLRTSAQDLDVHAKEEVALMLGPRGVRAKDPRGELHERRRKELELAHRQIQIQDKRTWIALKRSYSFAEQAATNQFQTTVLFEPWGGSFGVTRYGAEHFGWTNSQPLDALDGFDLLSSKGQRLLWRTLHEHRPYLVIIAFDCRIWSLLNNLCSATGHSSFLEFLRSTVGKQTLKLVVSICKHQHKQFRYYLIENPAGSQAWPYESILAQLLTEEFGGKFVVGDQCRYGKVDRESGRPIMKPTGWLSNNEPILNALGRRCKCSFGAHQTVVGSNKFGKRSLQAAAYPLGVCAAICEAVLKSMILDYAARTSEELSYPAMEVDEPEEPEIQVIGDESTMDYWELQPESMIRHHVFPRKALFSPMSVEELPCDFHRLLPSRTSKMQFEDGTEKEHVDEWTSPEDPFRRGQLSWLGTTEIKLLPMAEDEAMPEAVPETPAPFTPAADAAPMTPAPETPGGGGALRRKRPRTRQLQRGFWHQVSSVDFQSLLERTRDWLTDHGGSDWQILPLGEDLGHDWLVHESANAELQLVLVSSNARRLRKPQPFLSPAEAPLRKANLLLKNRVCLSTAWEDWAQLAPTSQTRPLVAQQRQLCVICFGKPLGEDPHVEPQSDPRAGERERLREQRWQSLPRELKLAIRRVHVNLGHAPVPAMLKALRVSRASEVAIRACRLFRCVDCPRVQLPKKPRPSKLPLSEEFNTHVGIDILQARDADGHTWSWLNILCQGTTFQICVLLDDTSFNPTSEAVLRAFEIGWTSWAGYPEYGVFSDRAKYFISEFAQAMEAAGCDFDCAARASPWQLGQVERHGHIWKSILKRIVWCEQLAGRDQMFHATSAVNSAKNNLVRKSGFSPSQWVLGKSIRLPTDLTEDSEAVRLGALSLSMNPSNQFYLKTKLRFAAREAFMQVSNSEALKRAELRKVKPSRGPFDVGRYVFYFDASDTVPGPACWRGVARVIGKEGTHTVWIAHRGIILAVSPEHLAFADDHEVQNWSVVGSEVELLDTQPAAGGNTFVDLRQQPKPSRDGYEPETEELEDLPRPLLDQPMPQVDEELYEPTDPGDHLEAPPVAEELLAPSLKPPAESEDLSSDSLSMARMRYESERDAKKAIKSSEFFAKKREERLHRQEERRQRFQQSEAARQFEAASVPIPRAEYDPDVDDYHQSVPSPKRLPAISEDPDADARERESKRLRSAEEITSADAQASGLFAYLVVEQTGHLISEARRHFYAHEAFYTEHDVSIDVFEFGIKRNDFNSRYCDMYDFAMGATPGTAAGKKRGRKELFLKDVAEDIREQFTGPQGADNKEWRAWQEKEAVDILNLEESKKVRERSPELIVPTRWVRTNKSEGMPGQPFLAKSRLVVQGFKDRSLGYYRRDAPTASSLAESICLAVSAYMGFTMICKDVKNAYFSGRSLEREIYLEQPRGGLGNFVPGQLLRAKKAIYGFSEAARLFWVALKGHLESDGWVQSRLEPALFS